MMPSTPGHIVVNPEPESPVSRARAAIFITHFWAGFGGERLWSGPLTALPSRPLPSLSLNKGEQEINWKN